MDAGLRFIERAIRIGALTFPEEGVRLKSQRLSPYFLNSGLFNSGGDLTFLAGLYAEVIGPEIISDFDGFIGPPYKGTFLVGPVLMAVHHRSVSNLFCSSYRKRAKGHGERGVLIGGDVKGKKMMVIDDALTTASSLAKAFEVVRAHGGTPVGCVVIFDRQEKNRRTGLTSAQAFEKKYDVPVVSLANLRDLLTVLGCPNLNLPNREQVLERVAVYIKRYCLV